MTKKLIIVLSLTLLSSSTISAFSYKETKAKYDKINESYENYQNLVNNYKDEVGNKVAKFKDSKSNHIQGSVNWSLVNQDCKFDPKIQFADALDKYMEKIKKIMSDVMSNIPNLLKNNTLGETCTKIAKGICYTGKSMEYMNWKAYRSDSTKCIADANKGTLTYDMGSNTGTVLIGCGVESGDGKQYKLPLAGNPSVGYYWECPEYVPTGTPMSFPLMESDSGFKIDKKGAKVSLKCANKYYKQYGAEAEKNCMDVEKENCINFLQKMTVTGEFSGINDFEAQIQKCKINSKTIDADMEKFIKEDLEGTKMPNNQIIKNGKIVKDNPNEPDLSYKFNQEDIKDIKNDTLIYFKQSIDGSMKHKEKIATALINKNEIEKDRRILALEGKEFDKLLSGKQEDIDDFVYKKLKYVNKNIIKEYYINHERYLIYKEYIEERNNIMTKKFNQYKSFDSMTMIKYDEQLTKEYNYVKSNLKIFYESYNVDIKKFDSIMKKIESKIVMMNDKYTAHELIYGVSNKRYNIKTGNYGKK